MPALRPRYLPENERVSILARPKDRSTGQEDPRERVAVPARMPLQAWAIVRNDSLLEVILTRIVHTSGFFLCPRRRFGILDKFGFRQACKVEQLPIEQLRGRYASKPSKHVFDTARVLLVPLRQHRLDLLSL